MSDEQFTHVNEKLPDYGKPVEYVIVAKATGVFEESEESELGVWRMDSNLYDPMAVQWRYLEDAEANEKKADDV